MPDYVVRPIGLSEKETKSGTVMFGAGHNWNGRQTVVHAADQQEARTVGAKRLGLHPNRVTVENIGDYAPAEVPE